MVRSKLIKNNLKIAVRNLRRNTFYSLITIFGLAIGIACFTLIVLFVRDELAYDTFHKKKDRIYRVCEKLDAEEGQGENSSSQPFPVAQALMNDYPHLVEQSVRFFNFQQPSHTLQYKDIKINEKRTFFADSGLFKMFDFPLLKGNKDKVLTEVNSIVLSQETARKYFGNEDPMGKMLRFDGNTELMVTGIFGELPTQSHIHFDCLISFSTLKTLLGPNIGSKNWVWNPCWTYILLKDQAKPEELEAQFPSFIKKYFPDFIVPQARLYLQKLTDIHLTSKLDYELEPNSDAADIFIFSGIGLFILIIACINFMNLSTARSAKRAREVGMRKVFGSYKSQLIRQFLGESVLLSYLSLLLAFVLVMALLPVFNSFSGKDFTVLAAFDSGIIMMLMALTLFVGLASGIYPALYLSAFEPTQVLKGTFSTAKAGQFFRQTLVVVQFAISIALIIGTVIISRQLDYLRTADLGFKKEEVLVLPVRPPMAKAYVPFSEELRTEGRILSIAAMNDILGASHNTHEYNYEGMPQSKTWIYFPSLIVSSEFVQTLGIKLVAGRNFDRNIKSDDSLAVIINESMVKHLGWGTAQNALGKQFYTPSGHERVIGVAKDFNFVSLKETVGPFVLDLADKRNRLFWTKFIVIRIPPANVKATLEYIEKKWNTFSEEYPFEYFFLDENLNQLYRSQDNLARLVGYFSVLAIFIACLGLFALASFTAEQRTREIGIRKVIGASVYSLVLLMSKEFVKLVLISALISWPIIWWAMNNWLQNFAYRISIGYGIFFVASVFGLVIAFVTVLFHALRSALSNPVKTLKYE